MKTWGHDVRPDSAVDAVAARTALRDAYVATKELKSAIQTGRHQSIRMAWISCLTYLRAVGHVLDKVDGRRSKWLREAGTRKHDECKQDRFGNLIFWEFIEAERNLLLKEYRSSIWEKRSAQPSGNGEPILLDILIGTEVFGPADAVQASLEWWERYLDGVEGVARSLRIQAKNARRQRGSD